LIIENITKLCLILVERPLLALVVIKIPTEDIFLDIPNLKIIHQYQLKYDLHNFDTNWKSLHKLMPIENIFLYLIMSPRECSQRQEKALNCTSYSFTTSDPLDVEGM
jgi:hypothetical protein